MRSMRARSLFRCPGIVLLTVGALLSEPPSVESGVRELVRADAALYVELEAVSGQLRTAEAKALLDRLQSSTLVSRWKESPEFERMQKMNRAIAARAGQQLLPLLEDLFSGRVGIAVYFHENESPTGVFLLDASPEQTARWLGIWDRIDPRDVVTVPGAPEIQRRSKADETDQFFARVGDVLVISDRQSAIEEVIELAHEIELGRPDGSLAANQRFQQAVTTIPDSCIGFAFANPRAFDQEFSGTPLEQFVVQSEFLIAGLRIDHGAILDFHLQLGQPLFPGKQFTGPSPLLDAVSPGAFLWIQASLPVLEIERFITSQASRIPEPKQRELRLLRAGMSGIFLQLDPIDDLLRQLGPTMVTTVSITEGLIPFGLEVLVEWNRDADSEQTARRMAALDNGFHTLLKMADSYAAIGTELPDRVRSDESRPGQIRRWLEPLPGLTPGYELTGQRIRFGTRTDLVRGNDLPREPAPRLEQLVRGDLANMSSYLIIDLARVREWLGSDRGQMLQWLVNVQGLENEAAGRRLSSLQEVLEPIDLAFWGMHTEANNLHAIIGLRIDQPVQATQSK